MKTIMSSLGKEGGPMCGVVDVASLHAPVVPGGMEHGLST